MIRKRASVIENMKKYGQNRYLYGLILVMAVVFVYFFSYSTSTFYPYYFGGDSAQFQTIGKAWAAGKIPYKDMFDHKGPYIFFVNMLGYKLTGNSCGVMLLQMLNMMASLAGIFKLSRLTANKSNVYGIAAIIVTSAVLALSYSHGNMTEEYCFPFICFSTYLQAGYLLHSPEDRIFPEHNVKHGFFYGVSFAVCFLTRITNGVTICAGVLLTGLILLRDGRYGNLRNNAVSFCGGILTVFAPFAVYFWKRNAFREFLYGTIGFNMEYQRGMVSWLTKATCVSWGSFFIVCVPYYTIFATIFLLCRRKQYALAVYGVICSILEGYLLFSGAQYWQYVMITVPQFVLFLNEVRLAGAGMKRGRFLTIMAACGAAAIFCVSISKVINMHNMYGSKRQAGYQELLDLIPEEDRGSFIVYGGTPQSKQIYLSNDLLPCKKYFILQEWHAGFSEEVKRDIHEEFASESPQWILTEGSVDNIRDILDAAYECAGTAEGYGLYHLRLACYNRNEK